MNHQNRKNAESGNVLFLILIAVALFAALSYAVTRSTRTTADNSGSQSDVINAAALVEYPAGIRSALVRMQIDGVSVEDLEFNSPADFNTLSAPYLAVFHPDGGNATYQMAAPDAMTSGAQGQWFFNAVFEIDNIGSEIAGSFSGNDVVAFLPGIREGICRRINKEMGMSDTIPIASTDLSAAYETTMDDSYDPADSEIVIGDLGGNGTESLTGQPFGCFRNADGTLVYYHVLIER